MKKKILLLFTVLLILPQMVFAKNYIDADDNLELDGKYNGSTLHAGENIQSNADIKGISAMAAGNLDFSGTSEYSFLAGNKIRFEGTIKNDLYAAGSSIIFTGTVKRDANIAAETVVLKGNINRDIRIYADEVTLDGANVLNNITIYAKTIKIKDAKINGTLKYNSNAVIDGNIKDYTTKTYIVKEKKVNAMDTISNTIISILSMLLIGFVISFITPNVFKRLKDTDTNVQESLKYICIGFVILFGVPIAAILSMITIIAVPLSIIALLIYGMILYISSILSGYVIGHNLLTKAFNKEENLYLSLLIGIALIKFIAYLPILGGLVSTMALLYGIGIVTKIIPKK